MNTLDAIKARHSYRGKYLPTAIPREDLVAIMEAGLAALPAAIPRPQASLQ